MNKILEQLIGQNLHSIKGKYLNIIHPSTSVFYFEQNFVIHAGSQYFVFEISYKEIGIDDLHYLHLKTLNEKKTNSLKGGGFTFAGNFKINEVVLLRNKGLLNYENTFDGMILKSKDNLIITIIPTGSVPEIEITFNEKISLLKDFDILNRLY